jgi:predicted nucleic acid-binding protein
MNASLDTDIIIHLYRAGEKQLIYSLFGGLYVYEYLVEQELKNNARDVYLEFRKDIEDGLVNEVTSTDLQKKHVKVLFDKYAQDFQYLFDRGEMYAVALARAMGIEVLLSDDTKQFGPHDTLLRGLITDVMPFAFYELLFLRYASSAITVAELHKQFDAVSKPFDYPMNFRGRMGRTIRRFGKNGTERDRVWIGQYCSECGADLTKKLAELRRYIKSL